jgi:predicted nucleic acid-binding protein
MTNRRLLFDANVIYRLIREQPDAALDKLVEGSTIYLAYYELGNALWRESFLLKRISREEAQESLGLMYDVLRLMEVASVGNEAGAAVLEVACRFSLTFYDSAYLAEAKQSNKILVTDDKKLAKAAETLGVKTLSSSALM